MSEASSSESSPRYDSGTLRQLLEQLHLADEHFAAARRRVETLLDWQDYDHPDHEKVEADLRAANSEIQSITARIDELLSR